MFPNVYGKVVGPRHFFDTAELFAREYLDFCFYILVRTAKKQTTTHSIDADAARSCVYKFCDVIS